MERTTDDGAEGFSSLPPFSVFLLLLGLLDVDGGTGLSLRLEACTRLVLGWYPDDTGLLLDGCAGKSLSPFFELLFLR